MAIRNAAKAIIYHDEKILLNQCRDNMNNVYYDLPGGGQKIYESMETAVCREIMEETGYTAKIIRFAALAEEIYTDPEIQKKHPNYTHKIHHIFLVELTDIPRQRPSELDNEMEDSVWLSIEEAAQVDLRPAGLGKQLPEILANTYPIYLDTIFM